MFSPNVRKFSNEKIVKPSEPPHLTILTGPPRSGKTMYADEKAHDETQANFVKIEGQGDKNSMTQIFHFLSQGFNVVYETNQILALIPVAILDRADTIEIFRKTY